ncbi:MAG TPA: amidase [Chloroflexota bacterium]|nr:amidase [Chloroflexota bacterium]
MSDLTDLTIVEADRALRHGAVSAVMLTEATLERIEETEPRIHAYAHVYRREALDQARDRDREAAAGHWRGPLHGIPLAAKDLLYTTDAPTEAGSRAMEGFVAPDEATVIERLREAGAVIVGKTVTHELAYGVNEPPTRSPWGEGHYPGGSSAGSGAAVAARSAFGAIGTDSGGSIREPAALNGLVGMKPTFGRVSRHGVVPLSSSLDHVGPMTRTVADNALLLQAIAGKDPRDPSTLDEPVPDYLRGMEGSLRGMTIGVERRYFFGPAVKSEVRAAVDEVLSELSAHGADVIEVSMPELDQVGTVGLTLLLAEASAEHRGLLRERGDRLDPATRVMLELGELIPATHYVLAQRARTVLQRRIHDLFESHALDALLSPTLPTTTVPMDAVRSPDETGQEAMTSAINATWPANVFGLPALTFPCGFSSEGLPIGAQVMGRPFGEPSLYRIARHYERNHDWPARRPPLGPSAP